MCGNRLKAWKTIPMWRRTLSSSVASVVISSPSKRIRPSLIGSIRFAHFSRVDLPQPDAPIRQITLCGGTSRSIPRSTSTSP